MARSTTVDGMGRIGGWATVAIAGAGGLLAATEARAQELRRDVVVTAPETPGRVHPPRATADDAFLRARQPRTVAEALRFLPGVSARPNSRGETVARVRGAEERQTQVFLDGAPLAVPWDGRIDLGVLPAGLIQRVEVAKGAVPIEYGPNAVAGAIDLRTDGARGVRAMTQGGNGGFGAGSLVAEFGGNGMEVLLAASGLTRDREPVASYAATPFSQARDGGRTNTDLDSVSLFGALELGDADATTRVSLLRVATRRGIAPESDRDPAVTAPRFWRYPHIDLTQLTVSSSIAVGDGATVRAVGWRQWFDQAIDQYASAAYTVRRSRQDDEDDTLGGRLTLAVGLGDLDLRLTGTAQTSRHAQVDTDLVSGMAGPRLVYRQNLYTLGAELDAPLGPVRATAGIGYDRSSTPLTGDKPAQPDAGALAVSLAGVADLASGVTLTLSGGRRARFPSARELFGEALGRFLVNPDLRPEVAWLADAELAWQRENASLTINPFYIRGRGTLGQRVVRVGSASLRQRYNLSGTRGYGIDLRGTATIGQALEAELFGTAQDARADPGDAPYRRLTQRPAFEVGGALSYAPYDAALLRAEYRRVGPAVDLDATGARATLPGGDEVNLRARLPVARLSGSRLSVTAAVDNLTDDVVTPQLGLPLPGRTVRVGLSVD